MAKAAKSKQANSPKVNKTDKISKKAMKKKNNGNAQLATKNLPKNKPAAIFNGTDSSSQHLVPKVSLKLHLKSCDMKQIQHLLKAVSGRINGYFNIEYDSIDEANKEKLEIEKLVNGSRFQLFDKMQRYSENKSSLEVNLPQLNTTELEELKTAMNATSISAKGGNHSGFYIAQYDSPADAKKIFEAGSFSFQITSKNSTQLVYPCFSRTNILNPPSTPSKSPSKKNKKRKNVTDNQGQNKKMKGQKKQNKKNKTNGVEEMEETVED